MHSSEAILITDADERPGTRKPIPLNFYLAKKTMHNNVIGPWQPCILKNSRDRRFNVKFIKDDFRKNVALYEIAKQIVPDHADIKDIGTRVISMRNSRYSPYTMSDRNEKIPLIASGEGQFYPGIIAREFGDRYCVFFDDGMVQIVKRDDIRRVEGNNRYENAHRNARRFFEFYATKEQEEIQLDENTVHKIFPIELNGVPQMATVIEVDEILAKIHFPHIKRFEWIYCGSPRINNVYRNHLKLKSLDHIVEFKTFKLCLHPNPDVVTIELPIPPIDHICRPQCVSQMESSVQFKSYSVLEYPKMTGWSEEDGVYTAPCGITLSGLHEIHNYLDKTRSKLRIDSFNVGPKSDKDILIIEDISKGLEKIPITVQNKKMPMNDIFTYITENNFDYVDVEKRNDLNRKGCKCTDNCRNKLKCSCWQLTVGKNYKKQKNVGYKKRRLNNLVDTGIVECGANCKCCADQCDNRVVQNGLQVKLEIFQTEKKGWGVRTKMDLPKGIFVCKYTGDVLEDTMAEKRNYKFHFELPKFANSESNAADSSDSKSDSDVECQSPPKKRRMEEYDVSQTFINYFPNWENKNFPDSEPVEPCYENSYIIDALHRGNISRFLNHSCDPNLIVQSVFIEDDKRFPAIAFFTGRPIKADEELAFDYKYELNDDRKTPCYCGAKNCRNRLL